MAPSTPFHGFSTLPTLASVARISRGGGMGTQSVAGAVSFLLNDARHLCQPLPHQPSALRSGRGSMRGPRLLVYSPLWSPS